MLVDLKPNSSGDVVNDFMEHARAARYWDAVLAFRTTLPDVEELLLLYLKLAEEDWPAFMKLADHFSAHPSNLGRFCFTVVQDGYIPAAPDAIPEQGYDKARELILRVMSLKPSFAREHWPNRKEHARTYPFYPEMHHRYSNFEDRVIAIARKHTMPPLANPDDARNVALFSLGGFFDWNEATRSAKTKTTCVLFLRAVLHAAGWNTIRRGTTTFVSRGMYELLTQAEIDVGLFVRGSQLDSNSSPRPGDLFVLRGAPGPAENHLGMVLEPVAPGSRNWLVAEGGQEPEGIWSRTQTKTLHRIEPEQNRSADKTCSWAFKEDRTGAGRTIQGWYQLDRFPLAYRMSLTVA